MNLKISVGTPYPMQRKSGDVVNLILPSAASWYDIGIYANSTTVDGAEVELVGGGYRKVGSTRLMHFYMKGGSATLKALDAGGFDVVVKMPNAATAAKMAKRQETV